MSPPAKARETRPRPWRRTGVLLLSLLGVGALLAFRAPRSRLPQEAPRPLPTREELRRSLFQQQRLQVVYAGASATARHNYKEYFNQAPSRRFRLAVRSDRDYALDSLGVAPLRLVGALTQHRALQDLLPQLPLQRHQEGFVFAGQLYKDSADVLQLFYPNPRHPAMPLWIITGNSDAAVLACLQKSGSRFGDLGDYCVSAAGKMQVIGFFQDTGPLAWRVEGAQEMSLAREQKTAASTKNFVIITHGSAFEQQEVASFGAREEASLAALQQRLRLPETPARLPLRVHLWDSFEKKALFTRNADLRHFDPGLREVHLLWTPAVRGDDFFAEAQAFAAELLPQASAPALREGLAVALTRHWRGAGFAGWTTRLLSTGNAVTIEELFDPETWQAESPLLRQPLLGSLVNFLLQRYDRDEFERLYQSWPEKGLPEKFPRGETWEEVRDLCYRQVMQTPPVALRHTRPPAISPQNFHRGFCYAHEGYQVYNGYMGHRSRAALQKLAEFNVNAMSITPFSYVEHANQPGFPRRSDGLGAENDESLLAAQQFGREAGMRVMLKPHLWVGGSSSGWPGDIQMNSASDWNEFFRYYERWMRHYAMLAEMHAFDGLCLGVELVHATRGHEAQWRAMMHRWRGLYSGPMVYAANWGEEFERLGFWGDLEAIALNCYYPLSEKEQATDAELLSGANQIAEKVATVARKYHKPVLITEIGFCSRPGAWVQPHRDERRAPVEEEAQRRSYEAIYKALSRREWLAGIYWWKWPTDLSDGGPQDNQFTPNGKAAEQVVAKWYRSFERFSTPSGRD